MAKGKYLAWLEPEKLLQLTEWARSGLTDEQLAKQIGIVPSTYYDWVRRFGQISEAVTRGRVTATDQVENELHKRTRGQIVRLAQSIKLKRVTYDPETGKKSGEEEYLGEGYREEYIPADPRAQMYWLNNRRASHWKPDSKLAAAAPSPGDPDGEQTAGVVILPEALPEPEPPESLGIPEVGEADLDGTDSP